METVTPPGPGMLMLRTPVEPDVEENLRVGRGTVIVLRGAPSGRRRRGLEWQRGQRRAAQRQRWHGRGGGEIILLIVVGP